MFNPADFAQHQAALFKSNTQSINYQQALKASAEPRQPSLWERVRAFLAAEKGIAK